MNGSLVRIILRFLFIFSRSAQAREEILGNDATKVKILGKVIMTFHCDFFNHWQACTYKKIWGQTFEESAVVET